jgi:hypothetical protein
VGATWSNFRSQWNSLSGKGYRLIDFETYYEKSFDSARKYAGVFVGGNDRHALWVGASFDSFVAKWKSLAQDGLKLIDFEQLKKTKK